MRVVDVELLAAGWHVLRRTTLEYRMSRARGPASSARRTTAATARPCCSTTASAAPCCSPGSSATPSTSTTTPTACSIETAAGLLDDDDPVTAIRREAAEETGVEVGEVEHVFDVVHEPGIGHRARSTSSPRPTTARAAARRGGLLDEGEDIELVELGIDEALAMIRDGRIQDAKTIMLLQWAVLDGPFDRRWPRASGKERLSANPAEPGYPCYVSVLGELAWMPPRGELGPV